MPIQVNVPGLQVPAPTSPIDVATGAFVQGLCAAGGMVLSAAQLAVLPTLVTAASREISRFCGRLFPLASYFDILSPEGGRQDCGEPAIDKLTMYPVDTVTRVATGRTGALLVSNSDPTTNQDAWIGFNTSGSVEWAGTLLYTGLTLTRYTGGTQYQDVVSWTTASPYTTIQSVAATINGLGGGWSATVQSSGSGAQQIGGLPAAWLVGAREPKGAFSPGTTLDVFQTTAGVSYDIERRTGLLRCYFGGGLGGGWGGYGGDPWCGQGDGVWGYGGGVLGNAQVRVDYTAGFATVPEPLQRVCAECVKMTLDRLARDSSLKSENAGDYSYAVRDSWASLPDWCTQTLWLYKGSIL